MMISSPEALAQAMSTVAAAHIALESYHRELSALFQLVDDGLASSDPGRSLVPLNKEALFGHSAEHLLAQPKEWLSPWLGRFYLDARAVPAGSTPDDCTGNAAYNFAFVWICSHDAKASVEEPECWIGVSNPGFKNENERAYNVASKMWEQFRLDLGTSTTDGWLEGRFPKQKFGFASGGFWLVQRIRLSRIDSVAQIFGLLVQPLLNRHRERFAQ